MDKRHGHQIQAVGASPAKCFFAARRANPDARVRALQWLRQDVDVFEFVELAAKIDWPIGPGLADDFRAFGEACRCLIPVRAELAILDRLAALANAEIQTPPEITSAIA